MGTFADWLDVILLKERQKQANNRAVLVLKEIRYDAPGNTGKIGHISSSVEPSTELRGHKIRAFW